VECPRLPDPLNGRVSLSGLAFGSEATYTCLAGFQLVGSETRTCTAAGTWSLDPPVCATVEGTCVNHVKMYKFIVFILSQNLIVDGLTHLPMAR